MKERVRYAMEKVRVDVPMKSTGLPFAASTERFDVDVGVNVVGKIETDAPESTRKFTGACVAKVACIVKMGFDKTVEIVIAGVVEVCCGSYELLRMLEWTLSNFTVPPEVAL